MLEVENGLPETEKEGFSYEKWYEENKDKRNAERRKKYRQNLVHRAKCISAVLRSYYKRRKRDGLKRLENIEAYRPPMEIDISKTRKPVAGEDLNGKLVAMFHVGYLAQMIDRSAQVVRCWENNGAMPVTPYHGKRRQRLYTKEMMEAVYAAIEEQGFPKKINESLLRDGIAARWQALKVPLKFRRPRKRLAMVEI